MPFELVESAHGLGRLETDWADLQSRTPSHVFQTYGFLAPWYRTVGEPGGVSLAVVSYREGGRLMGVFPACVDRIMGLRVLTWLGGVYVCDYGDVLYDPESAELAVDDFLNEALDILAAAAPRAVKFFPNVRHDALAYGTLQRRFRTHRHDAAPHVLIDGDFDGYLGSLSQNTRHDVRRRVRRLSELGELRFAVLEREDPALDRVMDALIEQKKQRYHAAGARTVLWESCYEDFYREQARDNPDSHVSYLALDDAIIAAQFSYLCKDRLYLVVSSFDESYRDHSPGKVLIYHLIQFCHESGVGLMDFCLGSEPYKSDWAQAQVPQTSFVSDDAPGRLLSSAADVRRAMARRMRSRPAGKSAVPAR